MTSADAAGFEDIAVGGWTLAPGIETRFGAQYGDGINFGFGAVDDADERERSSVSLSLEPRLAFEHAFADGFFHGAVSVVGATNVLDGELSGQFARSGDSRVDIDEAFVGWRRDRFSVTLGPRTLSIGDGFVLGDGNFDVGDGQGQFWVGPFDAWKNAAVAAYAGERFRADAFWLRSDGGFGDARLYGVNAEFADPALGRYGFMVIDIYDGDALSYDGITAWNLRALDVPVPGLAQLKLYTEVVWQLGEDTDAGGGDNDALGWYVEVAYSIANLPWPSVLTYRYARFSGDDPDTADNETYRSLFYGFYAREWDTFYQGEIAGEYHLFNSNQVTQFIKFRTFPHERYALTAYYFQHDLEEKNFYGVPLASRDWADEVNVGIEYFRDDAAYVYAGVAWSKPNAAAREFFGSENFTVVQTWMSFSF